MSTNLLDEIWLLGELPSIRIVAWSPFIYSQGDDGDVGFSGPIGPQGDHGPRGSEGPDGKKGLPGDSGIPGLYGPKGKTDEESFAGSVLCIKVTKGHFRWMGIVNTSFFSLQFLIAFD